MRIVACIIICCGVVYANSVADAQSDVATGFACASDAFKFCVKTMKNGALVPDAIEACLRAHERSLSPGCRAAINGHKR